MGTKKKELGDSNQATPELVDPKTIEPHPKRHLVPAISKDQYEVIKADVKANSFRKPALVNQKGQMVDGHTRKQIAEELGIDLLIERRDLTPSEEMQHLVLDNLCRRHLTESQRAAMITDPSTSEEVMAPFRAAAKGKIKDGASKGGSAAANAKAEAKKAGKSAKAEATLPQGKKKRAPQVRDQVAKLAGVSGRTVSDAKAAWEKAPEKMRAVIKGESKQTVASVINEIRKEARASEAERAIKNGNVEFEKLFTLKIHDVWTFKDLDPGFGKTHPGNIPASLVANLLHYFTKPGDLVVDPMAGGGVTGDVCRALGRACLMADLHPHGERTDISQHKIEDGPVPGTEGKAALVFADPPYWTLNDDKYGEGAASSKPWAEWKAWLTRVAQVLAETVEPGGYVAVLMQDNLTKDVADDWSKPSTYFMAAALAKAGLKLAIQIACPLPFASGDPHDVEWAKREKRLLGINRTLLVFQKPKAKAEG
ncbi:MAG: hypothetical protein HYZ29_00900 [Myxococcales bacterium]|nr:hypothetical protein [Myxococcales bacterium]